MKPVPEPVVPHDISDATAAALFDFLYALAADCEARYSSQLRRHYARDPTRIDPRAALDHQAARLNTCLRRVPPCSRCASRLLQRGTFALE